MTARERLARVETLRRSRPRRPFVRWTCYALAALAAYAWLAGGLISSDLVSARRWASLVRFAGELVPHPLRESGVTISGLAAWAAELWSDRGHEAAVATLAISVAAIVLAGAAGGISTLTAARTLAAPEPFLPGPRPAGGGARAFWRLAVATTRLVQMFLRSIPEYVWVFLLIGVLGPTFWPAVLALMLHNAGILGRLNAEVIEDLDPAPLEALRGVGAGRLEIAGWAVAPLALPRFLLYFFYRWETCVREATVLGLLGIVSIGFWIQDARARQQPDTMLFFILLGALLVILGDLVSGLLRRWVREAR